MPFENLGSFEKKFIQVLKQFGAEREEDSTVVHRGSCVLPIALTPGGDPVRFVFPNKSQAVAAQGLLPQQFPNITIGEISPIVSLSSHSSTPVVPSGRSIKPKIVKGKPIVEDAVLERPVQAPRVQLARTTSMLIKDVAASVDRELTKLGYANTESVGALKVYYPVGTRNFDNAITFDRNESSAGKGTLKIAVRVADGLNKAAFEAISAHLSGELGLDTAFLLKQSFSHMSNMRIFTIMNELPVPMPRPPHWR